MRLVASRAVALAAFFVRTFVCLLSLLVPTLVCLVSFTLAFTLAAARLRLLWLGLTEF